MSYIPVALHTFDVVRHMGDVIYLMARVFCPYVVYFMAFLTGSREDFRSEDCALVFARYTLEHIAGSVQMCLELTDDSRLGVTVDAIGLCVN